MDIEQRLLDSLQTGFINSNNISLEEYQPSLLVNDSKRGKKVITCLIDELWKCEAFFFSVAFITNSGVATLINTLKILEEKGIKGKIIASQYQNFTEPMALKRLIQFKNLEIKIVTEGNFHAKGYIFKRCDTYSMIIGSSNLTQNALSMNKEWNVKLSSSNSGSLIINTLKEFDYTFKNATVVNEIWIDEYDKIYNDSKIMSGLSNKNIEAEEIYHDEIVRKIHSIKRITPNKMQLDALASLEELRSDAKDKALLISATGTGKTYLSAFDVKKYKPKRFLFIVHRENIARAAMRSYKAIFGQTKTMGILSGNSKDVDSEFIFTTIQTLSKDNILHSFAKDCFDYIVIDEVHRSGAYTYKKIIEYFKPEFFLGMSATPERTDGYDIFKTFDYNIAYEIRLNNALEENMLVPFHYYGVSDIIVDGEVLDDKSDFNKLVCSERVEKIIHFAQFYGCDKGRVKSLIFCSRIKEAKELSLEFNKRGYRTISLDGDSSELLRENSINQLEQEEGDNALDFIFTVDIFNEGVDIPSVNQIIMLRPTQSAIIFVQQLGRGLRKNQNKVYLTVIDFIGNYTNNYLIPIALYGDNSYKKDNIRKLIKSGSSYIPGASTVNFDQLTKQRIFKAIDDTNLSKKRELIKDYKLLKYKLGRHPKMIDFVGHGSRDPYAYIEYGGSYYTFISGVDDDVRGQLSPKEIKLLEFYSKEVCNAKRIEEVVLLRKLLDNNKENTKDFLEYIKAQYGYTPTKETINAVVECLNSEFLNKQEKLKYEVEGTVEVIGDVFEISRHLLNVLSNKFFKLYLLDSLEYAINKFNISFSIDKYYDGFLLYEKYSRKDVCRILEWKKDESSTMYGYRIKHKTCPIFVTYKKTDDISESTKYEDSFINSRQFSWMTRNKVKLDSSEVVQIKNHKEGLRILLFIKKSDGEGSDFYYMGDMEPYDFIQKTIRNDIGVDLPIVNIKFNMHVPAEDNMLHYLEN